MTMANVNERPHNKRCSRCRHWKNQTEFHFDKSCPDGLDRRCKACRNDLRKDGLRQDPDAPLNGLLCGFCEVEIRGRWNRRWCSDSCSQRAKRLKRHFGLTVGQYKRLVEATGGLCPICEKPPSKARGWSVDHNHTTGEVTGVVCMDCNTRTLASVQHDKDKAKRLLGYLTIPPARAMGINAFAPGRPDNRTPARLHEIWKNAQGQNG